MKLQKAIDLIGQTVSRMLLHSGQPIFDEWMIVNLQGGKIDLIHYYGNRFKTSPKKISLDMRGLKEEMKEDGYVPGEFFFNPDAEGTLYDAFMVVGPKKYLLFNNTRMKMADITKDPFWKKTQIHFVELSEHFFADALE